jgi:cytochrome c peroxidase
VIPGLFGPRNAPSAMYNAAFAPPLMPGGDDGGKGFTGGQFRDGRVDFVEDQAKLPFLNPMEMANPDAAAVVAKVKAAKYAADFKAVYGADIFDDNEAAYSAIADALGAFQRGKTFMPFSSKFDAYQRGETTLSDAEARGLVLFTNPIKGNCAACHSPTSTRADGLKSVFTDFGYDNIGVPRNPANKFYSMPPQFNPDGKKYIDIGLRGTLPYDFTKGQFKAPTLRNIAITAPYMHNGYFKTLEGVLDFYNTRDIRPVCPKRFTSEAEAQAQGCWPEAEVTKNVNKVDMGKLGLTAQEIDDIVAYHGTLTDGWTPP